MDEGMDVTGNDNFLALMADAFVVIESPSEGLVFTIGDLYVTEPELVYIPYRRLSHKYNTEKVGTLGLQLWRLQTGASMGLAGIEYKNSGAANELIDAANPAAIIRSEQWGRSLSERIAQGIFNPLRISRSLLEAVTASEDGYDSSVRIALEGGDELEIGAPFYGDFALLLSKWVDGELEPDVAVGLSLTKCPRWENLIADLAKGGRYEVERSFSEAMASSNYAKMFFAEYLKLTGKEMENVRAALADERGQFSTTFDEFIDAAREDMKGAKVIIAAFLPVSAFAAGMSYFSDSNGDLLRLLWAGLSVAALVGIAVKAHHWYQMKKATG